MTWAALVTTFVVASLAPGCGEQSDDEPATAPSSAQSQDTRPDTQSGDDGAEAATRALSARFQEAVKDGATVDALIDEATALVERHPDHWQARLLLAQMLLSAERYVESYDQFQRTLELNADYAELHLLSGTVAMELDKVDEAMTHYEKAVSLEPREGRYRLHLAHGFMRQQRFDQARHQLLVALRHDAEMHKAHAALADLYGQQNQITPALSHIRQALDLLPPDDELDREQWQQKVIYVRRRANLLRRDLQPADALSVLRDLPRERQFEPGVMEDMARCWAMLGEPVKAAEHYEQALERAPRDPSMAVAAAQWYLRAGRPDDAARMLERLQRISPNHAQLDELWEQVRAAAVPQEE